MTEFPIAYDITRLATRVLSRTPNGIDRIDSAFARHFLDRDSRNSSAMMMTILGPRVISSAAGIDAVNGIFAHWGEDEAPDADESYCRILSWTAGRTPAFKGSGRVARGRKGQISAVARWIGRHGFPIGRSPAALPVGARYLNVSQFPLWTPGYFSWLKQRPDLKGVFFIHDLLPIETPEYFRKGEFGRHLRRLANLADFGAAAIVTTEVVKEALERHLASLGRTDLPISRRADSGGADLLRARGDSARYGEGALFRGLRDYRTAQEPSLVAACLARTRAPRRGRRSQARFDRGARLENENVVDLLEDAARSAITSSRRRDFRRRVSRRCSTARARCWRHPSQRVMDSPLPRRWRRERRSSPRTSPHFAKPPADESSRSARSTVKSGSRRF